VFQGRQVTGLTPLTQVVFLGVPIDPPGTNCPGGLCHRTIRITNLRGDATSLAVATGVFAPPTPVTAISSANPPPALPVNVGGVGIDIGHVVPGLIGPTVSANFNFLQCVCVGPQCTPPTPLIGNPPSVTFREGFANAFKPRNIAHEVIN